jgi:hypothetical protein
MSWCIRSTPIDSLDGIGSSIDPRPCHLILVLPDSLEIAMSTEPVTPGSQSLELAVEELFRRARPLPPHEDMVIQDLDDDEGAAFLAILEG